MAEHRDDRSPFALALEWSSRITTIALEMALPGVGGLWLDQWLGTRVVFMILGVVAGFVVGMWHIVQLAKPPHDKGNGSSSQKND